METSFFMPTQVRMGRNVVQESGALLAGQTVPLFGLPLPVQSFAVLALAPIWLYRGRQGPHGRAVRWLFYGFYPLHLLALAAAEWLLF